MNLLKEGKLYSIVRSKCPRCNLGDLYVDNRLYRLNKLAQMHKTCSCCGQKYEPENGFYYGAMYISYALSVGFVLPVFSILLWVFKLAILPISISLFLVIMALYPVIFRWSRNIWLNIFVAYDPEEHEQALANGCK